MPGTPRLVPIPPTEGAPFPLGKAPCWIGTGANASLVVRAPGLAERHACLTTTGEGIFLSGFPGASPPKLDGTPVTQPTRVQPGQVIELSPAARWTLQTEAGSRSPEAAVRDRATPAPRRAEPATAPPPTQAARPRAGFPVWAIVALIALGLGAIGAGYWIYRLYTGTAPATATATFTERETQLFDSLLVESSRAIERGSTLLDIGLPDAAAEEFALAIATFEKSLLADNQFVRPTIDALSGTVQDIYRYNRLTVPAAFAKDRGRRANLSAMWSARLTVEQFAAAVDRISDAFRRRFNRPVEVTGADHPEHLSLYGAGGAMDIRVKNLNPAQIGFLISGFGAVGVRVKDFSQDAVLQRQIKAAIAAGLADRAGTGLHLHIDRFRDRRDAYTVTPR